MDTNPANERYTGDYLTAEFSKDFQALIKYFQKNGLGTAEAYLLMRCCCSLMEKKDATYKEAGDRLCEILVKQATQFETSRAHSRGENGGEGPRPLDPKPSK